MSPHHHPLDATLLAYTAGALGEGLSLVVASHLAVCPDCRARAAVGEAIGGHFIEALAPEALDSRARDRVLALIAKGPQPRISAPVPHPLADPLVPPPLARYLRAGLDGIHWHPIAPGLSQVELVPRELLGGGNLRMLRIAKGKRLPRHSHTGTELTLVLKGAYSDATGQFGRGDLAETDDELTHEPVSGDVEDCICVIATEGPLKFDSAVARLFQRFTGF